MKCHLALVFCGLFAHGLGSPTEDKVNNLFWDYFDWKITKLNPEAGANKGYHDRLTGTELNTMSLEFALSVPKTCQKFKKRAQSLMQNHDLDEHSKHYVGLLVNEVDYCIRGFKMKGYLFPPIGFMGGVQVKLPRLFREDNILPYNSLQDYKNNLVRMSKIPKQLAEIQELLKEGVKNGLVYSNETTFRARSQFERIQVSDPKESEFYRQFEKMKQRLPEVEDWEIKRVQKEAQMIIKEQVIPAFQKLQDFIYNEYSQHLRKTSGVHSLPGGQDFYQACIDYHTTVSGFTPEAIHNIGLSEVKELRDKVKQASIDLGYGELSFEDFIIKLKSEKEQYFETGNETIAFFRDLMSEISPALDKVFSEEILQNYVYELEAKPVPPGGGGLAYYLQGSLDKKRKGAFYVNVNDVSQLKRFETMSLTLHEGNPGHHLQVSTAANDEGLPIFLKQGVYHWGVPSAPARYTAYTEGWALYAEYLGQEMGMFVKDKKQIMGFYSWNLLRAARLVVDTGIHALGWSHDKAVDYLYENTAMSRGLCEVQIDRYSSWPGQALAYKMGEREILKLRKKMEQKPGFRIQTFHDGVLGCKGPTDKLEDCFELQMQYKDGKKVFKHRKPRKSKASVTGISKITMIFVCLSIYILRV